MKVKLSDKRLSILEKTALDLYKEGKTLREVGGMLGKSRTWVWLIANRGKVGVKRSRQPHERFEIFNQSSLRKYKGEKIKFEDWLEYTKEWPKLCFCCGDKKPRGGLTIDHIKNHSNGGRHELGNLQVLCLKCNSRKGARDWDFRRNMVMFRESTGYLLTRT